MPITSPDFVAEGTLDNVNSPTYKMGVWNHPNGSVERIQVYTDTSWFGLSQTDRVVNEQLVAPTKIRKQPETLQYSETFRTQHLDQLASGFQQIHFALDTTAQMLMGINPAYIPFAAREFATGESSMVAGKQLSDFEWTMAGVSTLSAGAALLKAGKTALTLGNEIRVGLAEGRQALAIAEDLQPLMHTGGRVGPTFDPAKLDRIVARYEKMGGTVIRGDAATNVLRNNGGNALYFPVAGGPGAIFLGPNPTRLEVVEELIHMGQYRKLGWPSGRGRLSLDLEIEAQDILLNIAATQDWTPEETYKILKNQTHWLNEAGK